MSASSYTIKAIPTRYNGIQMRSRLEARWAAFFDLMKWQWEYEPFDLDGWVPDFVVGGAHGKTLVEVKPIDWPLGYVREIGFQGFDDEIARALIAGSAFSGILVCGLKPICIGSASNPDSDETPWWSPGAHWQYCLQRPSWRIAHAIKNNFTGIYDIATTSGPDIMPGLFTGDNYVCPQPHLDRNPYADEMMANWIEAGNRVQWKAPRLVGNR